MPSHSLKCRSFIHYVKPDSIDDETEEDRRLRRLLYNLKDGHLFNVRNDQWAKPAEVLARRVVRHRTANKKKLPCWGVLVPVPRSSATPNPYTPNRWPGLRLAMALVKAGCATDCRVALVRKTTIRKASKCRPDERPTVEEHIESMATLKALAGVDSITLVDDTLTRGTQLMGAMRLLQQRGFKGTVSAITAAHTYGDDGNRDPFRSFTITWDDGDPWGDRA